LILGYHFCDSPNTESLTAFLTTLRDAYGYRLGSVGALINTTLSTTPLPVEEIVRATGLTAIKVSAHLRVMIAKGHVAVSAAGFSVK
jgi:hypothetical protein